MTRPKKSDPSATKEEVNPLTKNFFKHLNELNSDGYLMTTRSSDGRVLVEFSPNVIDSSRFMKMRKIFDGV